MLVQQYENPLCTQPVGGTLKKQKHQMIKLQYRQIKGKTSLQWDESKRPINGFCHMSGLVLLWTRTISISSFINSAPQYEIGTVMSNLQFSEKNNRKTQHVSFHFILHIKPIVQTRSSHYKASGLAHMEQGFSHAYTGSACCFSPRPTDPATIFDFGVLVFSTEYHLWQEARGQCDQSINGLTSVSTA